MLSIRILFTLTIFTIQTAPMAATLCTGEEQSLFNCTTKRKIISLCGSKLLTKEEGYVQYKFGTRSKIDFHFPSEPSPQGRHFQLSSTAYAGGGKTHIKFSNENVEYIIFERTIKVDMDEKVNCRTIFSDGILVRKKGKEIVQYRCEGSDGIGVSAVAYEVLPTEFFRPIDRAKK